MRRLPIVSAVFSTLTVFSALFAPVVARADSYSFDISTGKSSMNSPTTSFSGTGTLTGTPVSGSPNTLSLTDVTGAAENYTFTGVVPLGAATSFNYDNLLYTNAGAQHVDASGVLLYLTYAGYPVGSTLAHVYDNSSGYHVDVFDLAEPADITPFDITRFDLVSSTPEPSSLALLGTGVLALVGVMRRKVSR